jgi:hypothetical protein
MPAPRHSIVTFKADADLLARLERVANRSAFIRSALLSALDQVCPVCRGSGLLSAGQRRHWEAFAAHHPLDRCDDCDEIHIVCDKTPQPNVHAAPAGAGRRSR